MAKAGGERRSRREHRPVRVVNERIALEICSKSGSWLVWWSILDVITVIVDFCSGRLAATEFFTARTQKCVY